MASSNGLDLNVSRTADIDIADSSLFNRSTDSAMTVARTGDILVGGNVWAASTNVGSGTRGEYRVNATKNGTEDTAIFHGNYIRGNQGSQDTFGYAANVLGAMAVTANDTVGLSVTESGSSHATTTQEATVGMWAVNLDTLTEPPTPQQSDDDLWDIEYDDETSLVEHDGTLNEVPETFTKAGRFSKRIAGHGVTTRVDGTRTVKHYRKNLWNGTAMEKHHIVKYTNPAVTYIISSDGKKVTKAVDPTTTDYYGEMYGSSS